MKNKITQKEIIPISIICFLIAIIITLFKIYNSNFYLNNFTLPFILSIIGYLILIFYLKIKPNKKSFIWLIPIILILISNYVVSLTWSNKLLNVFILPFLISIFFGNLINKKFQLNKKFWQLPILFIFKNLFQNFEEIRLLKIKKQPKDFSKYTNILLGFIFGLPLALIILKLLTSADQYFNTFIHSIINLFQITYDWDQLIHYLLSFFATFLIFFSIYQNTLKEKIPLSKSNYNINETIIKTILIIINFVFILFIISELSKLTFNFLKLPEKYTYAEYAREGFFQLLFVTAINFVIIIFLTYYTYHTQNKKIKLLLLLLTTFSIILIFNSYYRMYLYISKYGFTILRLQVILFLFMELILFILIFKKIYSKLNKEHILFSIIIISSYILNLYLCTNSFIKILNNIIS